MARTKFRVEVLTPEGEAFNDEVEQISTKTTLGSLGVLARHQPVLAMLEPTELRLYSGESDVVRYAQGEGFLQVSDEGTLILVDEVCTPDSSRFWPADAYEPGHAQPSFDKQFVRDWLDASGWDHEPPPPELPAEVVAATAARYREAYDRITGESFADFLQRMGVAGA